ncbi:MAG: quinolinate synthase NadA, partial [Thermodesulfobacteriota bacterium]|nr:quinolinate synthase NadA [Thermodesulfobacteriota bacterium]
MKKALDENQIKDRINEIKKTFGKKLLILTHHYQRKEVIELGHFIGDSFGLSQKAAADKVA